MDSTIDSQPGLVVWFTGLSAAGKTTLSDAVCARLRALDLAVEHLDGDLVRQHLCKGLGFSHEDRVENIRRISFVAEMLSRHGVVVLVSVISPYREMRDEARARIGASFVEVFVNAPLDVCMARDGKGLYQKALAGLLPAMTGIDDPYEPPAHPEVECLTAEETVEESVEKIMNYLNPRLGR